LPFAVMKLLKNTANCITAMPEKWVRGSRDMRHDTRAENKTFVLAFYFNDSPGFKVITVMTVHG
jgi:hypothetical protein